MWIMRKFLVEQREDLCLDDHYDFSYRDINGEIHGQQLDSERRSG